MRRTLIHVDADRTTNGQRFWTQLAARLNDRGAVVSQRVTLFNVSAPLSEIIKARLALRRVVLRVDGMYFDRLSSAFVQQFRSRVLRSLLGMSMSSPRLRNTGAFVANLLNRNYGAFSRIALASHVVYQSRFSERLYRSIFPRKPGNVILNGSQWLGASEGASAATVRLVTVCDSWRISKRIGDAIRFVRWARETRGYPVELLLLGYDEKRRPTDITDDDAALVRDASYITTAPPFRDLDASMVSSCHAYLSLTFRDACPNAVIEVMACGVPVVGIASGGVPEIVGDAGILIPSGEDESQLFVSHRFEHAFPPIDREALLAAVKRVAENRAGFQKRVRQRFTDDLDIAVAADRYFALAMR